jgi:hypothetical protein
MVIYKDNNCKKRACFNILGSTKPSFYGTHKSDNLVDVVHKKCINVD